MSQLNQPCRLKAPPVLTKPNQGSRLLSLFLRDPAMPQPQIKFAHASGQRRSGMTLIELLVAVSILVIIAAILVPQLRFASADRNIREASRVAASLFAQASQRAINNGDAGVVIERNPNIIDATTGSAYAGTSMFMLRKVPRYIGEDASDVAELVRLDSSADFPDEPNVHPTDIFITMPLEQAALGIIRVGDQISFDLKTTIRFVITKIDFSVADQTDPVDKQQKLRLSISPASTFLNNSFPNPEITNQGGKSRKAFDSFTIYRQPRKLISSRVDLPSGYLIDLRLSGEAVPDPTVQQTFFGLDTRSVGTATVPNSITYLFNGRGAIDRFFYSFQDNTGAFVRGFQTPSQPAYLMVREYSTDENGELIGNVLGSERTMWVTVEPDSGAANVVSGVGVDLSTFGGFPDPLRQALREARKLSSQGQQAAQ